ncbi:Hsp20/alpha crystallin family protein [Bacillus sp. S/N-304-OC-R1]|uniref:Hsp20/alpha crystallin family protein n=1 Tax=Bacillus sp. S/N-304-OC-R1 TaxID=2758034 RepID=UPI001C8D669E|nr:Hsp20/alpha crystallin family protein [Bacillus sp. S/N-304-OC-R1]MBY0124536.1 Hsp20/alpha crystallin family protein [Bacillus sp. S/N-304-OC-R1]
MDMEKLKQWLELTQQYQSQNFWNEVFDGKKEFPVQASEQQVTDFFSNQNIFPRCDVYENENGLVVEAELPGVEKSDMKVFLQQRELVIKGECKTMQQSIKYYLKERPNRAFEKKIVIPIPINRQEIKTFFNNGILTIILPMNRTEEEDIPIEVDYNNS